MTVYPECREKCEGCGIAAGGKEEPYLFDHRGHRVCSWCVANWSERDKRAKREISLGEYQKGDIRAMDKGILTTPCNL